MYFNETCNYPGHIKKCVLLKPLNNVNKLDQTGKQQHGYKRNKSTATAGALLQSLIAREADDNCFVIIASSLCKQSSASSKVI